MGAIGRKARGRLRCPAPPIVAGASRTVFGERGPAAIDRAGAAPEAPAEVLRRQANLLGGRRHGGEQPAVDDHGALP